MEDLGVKLSIAMACDTPEAVNACAGRGVGVGILYRSVIDDEINSGALRTIDMPAFPVKLDSYIVYHRDRPLPYDARDFIALLRRCDFKAGPVRTLPMVGS